MVSRRSQSGPSDCQNSAYYTRQVSTIGHHCLVASVGNIVNGKEKMSNSIGYNEKAGRENLNSGIVHR